MPTLEQKMILVARNTDLLSSSKQHIVQWLKEDWSKNKGEPPRWLWRAVRSDQEVYSKYYRMEPEAMLQDLFIELLSSHRETILERKRKDRE